METKDLLINYLVRLSLALQAPADDIPENASIRDIVALRGFKTDLCAHFDRQLTSNQIRKWFLLQDKDLTFWLDALQKWPGLITHQDLSVEDIEQQIVGIKEQGSLTPGTSLTSPSSLVTWQDIVFSAIHTAASSAVFERVQVPTFGDKEKLEKFGVLDDYLKSTIPEFISGILQTYRNSTIFPLASDHPLIKKLDIFINHIRTNTYKISSKSRKNHLSIHKLRELWESIGESQQLVWPAGTSVQPSTPAKNLKYNLKQNDFHDLFFYLLDNKIIDINIDSVMACLELSLNNSKPFGNRLELLAKLFANHLSLGANNSPDITYELTIHSCGHGYMDKVMKKFLACLKQKLGNKLTYHFHDTESLISEVPSASSKQSRRERATSTTSSKAPHNDVITMLPCWMTCEMSSESSSRVTRLLTQAHIQNLPSVVNYLSRFGKLSSEYHLVHQYIEEGNTRAFIECVKQDPKLLKRTLCSHTLLHMAVMYNRLDITTFLIDRATQVFSSEKTVQALLAKTKVLYTGEAYTPLHLAVIHGKSQLIEGLLRLPSFSERTIDGYNALHLAIMHGQTNVVEALLSARKIDFIGIRAGVFFELEDETSGAFNYTALHLAVKHNRLDIIKLLKKQPNFIEIANRACKSSNDVADTALGLAIKNRHTDIIRYLLKVGVCDLDNKLKILRESLRKKDHTVVKAVLGDPAIGAYLIKHDYFLYRVIRNHAEDIAALFIKCFLLAENRQVEKEPAWQRPRHKALWKYAIETSAAGGECAILFLLLKHQVNGYEEDEEIDGIRLSECLLQAIDSNINLESALRQYLNTYFEIHDAWPKWLTYKLKIQLGINQTKNEFITAFIEDRKNYLHEIEKNTTLYKSKYKILYGSLSDDYEWDDIEPSEYEILIKNDYDEDIEGHITYKIRIGDTTFESTITDEQLKLHFGTLRFKKELYNSQDELLKQEQERLVTHDIDYGFLSDNSSNQDASNQLFIDYQEKLDTFHAKANDIRQQYFWQERHAILSFVLADVRKTTVSFCASDADIKNELEVVREGSIESDMDMDSSDLAEDILIDTVETSEIIEEIFDDAAKDVIFSELEQYETGIKREIKENIRKNGSAWLNESYYSDNDRDKKSSFIDEKRELTELQIIGNHCILEDLFDSVLDGADIKKLSQILIEQQICLNPLLAGRGRPSLTCIFNLFNILNINQDPKILAWILSKPELYQAMESGDAQDIFAHVSNNLHKEDFFSRFYTQAMKDPSQWISNNNYSHIPRHHRQAFIIGDRELTVHQLLSNKLILIRLLKDQVAFEFLVSFSNLLSKEVKLVDAIIILSDMLSREHICLNPRLLEDEYLSFEAMNDLYSLLFYNINKNNVHEKQASNIVNRYKRQDENVVVKALRDDDSFYHATLINIIYLGLQGRLEKDSILWRDIIKPLFPYLIRDDVEPQEGIESLLRSFREVKQANASKGLIEQCNWVALQQVCTPLLRRALSHHVVQSNPESFSEVAKVTYYSAFIHYVRHHPTITLIADERMAELDIPDFDLRGQAFVNPEAWDALIPGLANMLRVAEQADDEWSQRWFQGLKGTFEEWWARKEVPEIAAVEEWWARKKIPEIAAVLGHQLQFLSHDSGAVTESIGQGPPFCYEASLGGYSARLPAGEIAEKIHDICQQQMVEVDNYRRDPRVDLRPADIRVYPKRTERPIREQQVAVKGDLHGNALNMLHFLVYEGIVDLDPGDYARFAALYDALPDRYDLYPMYLLPEDGVPKKGEIYFKKSGQQLKYIALSPSTLLEPNGRLVKGTLDIPVDGSLSKLSLTRLRDQIFAEISKGGVIPAEDKTQDPEILRELADIIDTLIPGLEPRKLVIFIGDMLGDRGKNDKLQLLILYKLLKLNSNYNITLSNHDLAFLEFYYRINPENSAFFNDIILHIDRHHIEREPREITAERFATAKLETLVDEEQYSSLNNLRLAGMSHFQSEIVPLVTDAYFPRLRLINYTYDSANNTLRLYPHARIGRNAIKAIAKSFGITPEDDPHDPTSLIRTIDKINAFAMANPRYLVSQALMEKNSSIKNANDERNRGNQDPKKIDKERYKEYYPDKFPLSACLWTTLDAKPLANLAADPLNPSEQRYRIECIAGHDGTAGQDNNAYICVNADTGKRHTFSDGRVDLHYDGLLGATIPISYTDSSAKTLDFTAVPAPVEPKISYMASEPVTPAPSWSQAMWDVWLRFISQWSSSQPDVQEEADVAAAADMEIEEEPDRKPEPSAALPLAQMTALDEEPSVDADIEFSVEDEEDIKFSYLGSHSDTQLSDTDSSFFGHGVKRKAEDDADDRSMLTAAAKRQRDATQFDYYTSPAAKREMLQASKAYWRSDDTLEPAIEIKKALMGDTTNAALTFTQIAAGDDATKRSHSMLHVAASGAAIDDGTESPVELRYELAAGGDMMDVEATGGKEPSRIIALAEAAKRSGEARLRGGVALDEAVFVNVVEISAKDIAQGPAHLAEYVVALLTHKVLPLLPQAEWAQVRAHLNAKPDVANILNNMSQYASEIDNPWHGQYYQYEFIQQQHRHNVVPPEEVQTALARPTLTH